MRETWSQVIDRYVAEGRTVSGGSAVQTTFDAYSSSSAAGDTPDFGTGANPIVDLGLYNIDLAGQMDRFPGGGISYGVNYAADPSGINTISTNPAINPNPTGGWMTALTNTLQAATAGFTAYERGSPSVAIPRPAVPNQSVLGKIFAPPVAGSGGGVGPFSWGAIAVIGLGVVGLIVIAKVA